MTTIAERRAQSQAWLKNRRENPPERFAEKLAPGQVPYTPEERHRVRTLVAGAIAANISEQDEVEGVV